MEEEAKKKKVKMTISTAQAMGIRFQYVFGPISYVDITIIISALRAAVMVIVKCEYFSSRWVTHAKADSDYFFDSSALSYLASHDSERTADVDGDLNILAMGRWNTFSLLTFRKNRT
jgi:hypothetical protein